MSDPHSPPPGVRGDPHTMAPGNQTMAHHAGLGPGFRPPSHGEGHDHAVMLADYWRRFIVSLLLMIPILALTPEVQDLAGVGFIFPGQAFVIFLFATVIYLYGGWPFLTGFAKEVATRRIGMMTLITVAVTVAYVYSATVVLGLTVGMGFFWELATLIDIMLLGHYIEMRSVMGASQALETLVRIMPVSYTHLRAHETDSYLVCRLLLEKKKK